MTTGWQWPSPAEDHGPVVIEEDAILGEESRRPRQDQAFDIPTDFGKVLRGCRVRDPGDLLLDDRSLVEVTGDEVRSRADQLDPR